LSETEADWNGAIKIEYEHGEGSPASREMRESAELSNVENVLYVIRTIIYISERLELSVINRSNGVVKTERPLLLRDDKGGVHATTANRIVGLILIRFPIKGSVISARFDSFLPFGRSRAFKPRTGSFFFCLL